jgi:hypothetical protein
MKADLQAIKICDMRTLQLEKARLRRVCRRMERNMGDRALYAKKNYVVLLLNGMFPGIRKEKNLFKWVAEIVKGAWATGHLQSVLLTVVIALGEFLSVRFGAKFLANLFAGFDKRKTKGKDKDTKSGGEDASFAGA